MAHDRPPTAEANIATAAASGMLQGRRFLVTGGARGLGAAIVRTFADHGANGLIVDLKAPEDVGLPWPFTAADVTDEGAMRAATEAYVSAHGPFDGVVAAAGIVP